MRGSSPRAWGRCVLLPVYHPITPGSSPRAWGRCVVDAAGAGHAPGSSPRAWGRCRHDAGRNVLRRFIPTCVGQIELHSCFHRQHCGSSPRAWGRLTTVRIVVDTKSGSSPRAWGRCHQSIPRRYPRAVHPHVRGADRTPMAKVQVAAWFIPTCVGQMQKILPHIRRACWFIPTCVGQMRPALCEYLVPERFIPTCVGLIVYRIPPRPSHGGSSPRAWG